MNSQETGIIYYHEKVSLSNDSFGSDNLQITSDTLVEGTATAAIFQDSQVELPLFYCI
jgi:hypothetical protein